MLELPTGLGLRVSHYHEILERGVHADCVEVVTENFLDRGGRPRAVLEHVRRDLPLFLHGVGLSLGGLDPLDDDYLAGLARLCADFSPELVSDHLCFGTFGGARAYDLWPLPYTEEAVLHAARRIREVQDRLGRRIAIENVSTYAEFSTNALSEAQFVRAVIEESDCLCLLDVNNVYVSARNNGLSANDYLAVIPPESVAYYHLAGHRDLGTHLLDDHGAPVCDEVWALFDEALNLIGPRPTIIEWDSNLPSLERVEAEALTAKSRWHAPRGQEKTG